MNKEQLEEYLINFVVPDILRCMNENSQHNREGRYGFECNDKILHIEFDWKQNNESKIL